MTPSHISRGNGRRKPGYRAPPAFPLSPASNEAIGRFVRILARCGATSPDIVRAVRGEAARIPASWAARAGRVTRGMEYASHVLTLWFSEAAYLDPLGKPLALPLDGPSRSVAALVRTVDPSFDPRKVLDYLVRGGAIRRLGRRYLPRGRGLFFGGLRGAGYFYALRVLTNMLATLEHNLEVKHGRGWFQYSTENRQFPVRARAGLHKYVRRLGKDMIYRLDAHMHRREVSRRPGEPTMGVGVGMNLWEEDATTTREEHSQRSPRGHSGKRKINRGRRS